MLAVFRGRCASNVAGYFIYLRVGFKQTPLAIAFTPAFGGHFRRAVERYPVFFEKDLAPSSGRTHYRCEVLS